MADLQGSSSNTVAADFGRIGGTPISNKTTVLNELDAALNKKKPKIEYLFFKPTPHITLPFGYSISYNSYGHAAVRYQLPDGRDIVMNIEGKDPNGKNMVHFYDAEEYLFGLDKQEHSSQLGLYNRDIATVRVYDVPDENILAMHNYYVSLQQGYDQGKVKFNIFLGPLYNMIKNVFPNMALTGNCARWTSEGLLKAKVVTKITIWPKSIWINMFENYGITDIRSKENMSVVFYKRIPHCHHEYGAGGNLYTIDAVAPLQSLRSMSYFNLQSFADAIVHVPYGSMKARVDYNPYPSQPSKIRDLVNSRYTVAASTVGTLYVLHKYLKRAKFSRRGMRF
jgi:hypothetical protein